jgi:hypothetical protein
MSAPEARARLAQAQAELLRALTTGGAPPPGFDTAQLGVAAAALAAKRRREAAHAWPALVAALGPCFAPLFADFASRVPLPVHGGPLADGRAFARDLQARGALPDAGRLEALLVDLRYLRRLDGLVPRRGVAVRAAWLRQDRRVVLGVRLPGLGVRWLALP